MRLRDMNDADIGAVAGLLEVLARDYFLATCSPGQALAFLRDNDAQALRRMVAGGYAYQLAEIDGQLAGFIGMRERRHVYHLFVASRFQRRGVGRRLWENARQNAMDHGAEGVFTVNASNYAVPMYENLGFVRAAAMQTKNGLQFNPMIFGQSLTPFVGAP